MAEVQGRDVADESRKLMERGTLRLGPGSRRTVDIQRGMRTRGQDGSPAGGIAAVLLGGPTNEVTHLLLATPEYRLLPIALVADVRGEEVVFSLDCQGITTLPLWDPS